MDSCLRRNDTAAAAGAVVGVKWTEIGLASGPARVRDLWKREDLGPRVDGFSATIPKSSAVMLIVEGTSTYTPPAGGYLSDMVPTAEWDTQGPLERDRSFGGQAPGDGKPITIAGTVYKKGIGVSSNTILWYNLGRRCTRFTAVIGLDDEVAKGAVSSEGVDVRIVGDERTLFSAVITGPPKPHPADIDLTGIENLRLFVDAIRSTSSDHLDFADARIATGPTGIKGPMTVHRSSDRQTRLQSYFLSIGMREHRDIEQVFDARGRALQRQRESAFSIQISEERAKSRRD